MFEQIDNSFTNFLPADPIKENFVRQVKNACFSFVDPTPCGNPTLIAHSKDLAVELGISDEICESTEFAQYFSGNKIYPNTNPYAMCYGGHQFGHWAGQLGDGRAINLFEALFNDKRYAFQLKGAGKTPYSRSADGLAVLRSSIREYLCSEAMFHLGIPTTRALALISTGDQVWRDMMYDGNADYEPGAVVTRVAPSFIRFGNFQILAAQKDETNLQKLTEYTIQHFFPSLDKNDYLGLLQEVVRSTMSLIIEWERVGFVHGVMNTDNISILGLTIDYGPYGWIDNFDPGWTPNTTDRQEKRYRFGNQANIAYWNVYQLANALFPIIKDEKAIEKILDDVPQIYANLTQSMKFSKIGLPVLENQNLIIDLDKLLYQSEMDMTLFYRNLSNYTHETKESHISSLAEMSYSPHFEKYKNSWQNWFQDYGVAIDNNFDADRKKKMDKVNPKFVLRNYIAQMAIDKAYQGDHSLVEELNVAITAPYENNEINEKWFCKRPDWAKTKVGCSMLSCSS